MNVNVTETAVVSKGLVRAVRTFVDDGFNSVDVMWDNEMFRQSFIAVIDDYLGELYSDGKISHGKVICDDRNNGALAFKKGDFQMEVQFRQKNALITTRLIFEVTNANSS